MLNRRLYYDMFNEMFVLESPTLLKYFKRVTIDCEMKGRMTYLRNRLMKELG